MSQKEKDWTAEILANGPDVYTFPSPQRPGETVVMVCDGRQVACVSLNPAAVNGLIDRLHQLVGPDENEKVH